MGVNYQKIGVAGFGEGQCSTYTPTSLNQSPFNHHLPQSPIPPSIPIKSIPNPHYPPTYFSYNPHIFPHTQK